MGDGNLDKLLQTKSIFSAYEYKRNTKLAREIETRTITSFIAAIQETKLRFYLKDVLPAFTKILRWTSKLFCQLILQHWMVP